MTPEPVFGVIYLEPQCTVCLDSFGDTGPMWCQDDQWTGQKCEHCNEPLPDAIKYERVKS